MTISRFAPSPTGLLHAGNYRTAVFAYLFARHHGGEFIVRIEDTDRARSKKEYEENILDALSWLGLAPDTLYRQSEHRARHRELLERLIQEGKAYVSKETPQAPGDREEVIRLKNPGGVITFTDVIRGEISTDVTDLGDFIIARSLDEPVFHFAVVIDDADEGVTHVIRGGDHISNTARQMLIQRALDLPTPAYAHLPLILDTSHKKLSKRTGAKALTDYRELGILPEALLNYLSFLGWNPGDAREYLTLTELIEAFDLSRVQKGSAVFDEVKLLSVNQYWMRKLSDEEYIARGGFYTPYPEMLAKCVPLLKERAHTFREAQEIFEKELHYLITRPTLTQDLLRAKEVPTTSTGAALTLLSEAVRSLTSTSPEGIKEQLFPLADAEETKGKGGRGALLWPLRIALSGAERSPDPFTLISLLGKDEASARIEYARTLV